MALSPRNRRWVWFVVIAVPLLMALVCAGFVGVIGMAVSTVETDDLTPEDLEVVLHAREVAEALGRDEGSDPEVLISAKSRVLGWLPMMIHSERLGTLRVGTRVLTSPTPGQAKHELTVAEGRIMVGTVEGLPDQDWVPVPHGWWIERIDDVDQTSFMLVSGLRCVEWSVKGAAIRSPEQLEELTRDARRAFLETERSKPR